MDPILADVYECAVMVDAPIPEQTREQPECMDRQYLVHERFLAFQRLQGAATRRSITITGCVDDLWE